MKKWLLLIYKIPREPTAGRVFVWRKLKQIGALAVQDAVWVLPQSKRSAEHFQWPAAEFDPPADNRADQEVTYHGVEAIGNNIVLAANEGRSYVDAVDVSTGKLLDRLSAHLRFPDCLRVRKPRKLITQKAVS